LINWVLAEHPKRHIVELAALAHHRFVHIHPFYDGNGRTARLIMNLFLMQNGYPIVMVLKNDRKKYYRALSLADKGDPALFIRFMAQCVERSLDLYLKATTPMSQEQEEYLPLSRFEQKTELSAEYLNLLIRQGKLEGHKEGRNWVTSKEAINRYLKGRKRKRR
jgi:Fic family protein